MQFKTYIQALDESLRNGRKTLTTVEAKTGDLQWISVDFYFPNWE
jgi:hypothetical protein